MQALLQRAEAAERRVRQLEEALAQVGFSSDGHHIADFGAQGWGIQHPVECRPDLLDCRVNRAMMFISGPPAGGEGRYHVFIDEGDSLDFISLPSALASEEGN